jgi:hypothetical protein
MVTLSDPLRAPRSILGSLRSGLWRPSDLPALLRWRSRAKPRLEATEPEMTAQRRLRELGLSEPLRERFLRPLFAGEFFDLELGISSLLLDQAFLMMARGATSVPAEGMARSPSSWQAASRAACASARACSGSSRAASSSPAVSRSTRAR